MFCDFNVPYSPTPGLKMPTGPMDLPPCASWDQRVGLSLRFLANIPERIVSIIVHIAKLIFFAIAAALTGGQVKMINDFVEISARRLAINTLGLGIAAAGFFVPVNAQSWQAKVSMKIGGDKGTMDAAIFA